MATGEQIKSLVKCFLEQDEERFMSLAVQIAAHEARKGHGKLAAEIRGLVDKARALSSTRSAAKPVPLVHPRGDFAGLFTASYPDLRLSDMVLENALRIRLERVLHEQRARDKLRSHSLEPRRKVLLIGPPGSGKSMTAAVLAGELHLPLFVIRMDTLITKFMGETSAKLRLVFEAMTATRGVYLFDEFDSIGTHREMPNEVGEIRRVLNSFLQLLEHDQSDGLVMAATNHPQLLDDALFRRFDDVVEYQLPTPELALRTLKSKLAFFGKLQVDWDEAVTYTEGHSYAEIVRACADAAKAVVLSDRNSITTKDLRIAFEERDVAMRR
ncbi:MAG: ATP-binding protein [Myxococcales bacterium]|nr:ATP-binding protein [Myxococcales bacterium]